MKKWRIGRGRGERDNGKERLYSTTTLKNVR
jgi:hypothetical protein